MASTELVSDRIMVEILNWSYEGILLGISDDATFGLYENTILGVADSYKHREELGYKEGEWLGVSKWGVEGTTEGNFIVTNVYND